MKANRRLLAVSAALAPGIAIAAGVALSGCRAKEAALQPPPGNQEMKVQQTPVASMYDEKGGVLYERPAATPTSAAPQPAPTPSPTSSAPRKKP